ncbi:Mediator of RNA polymerase II transcription subunit 16 [Melipona quadrifasciata]|uniref:Mediator of RNA polymerase II transcription subunit 16 n=1 Tax=Melipona quadrifasciata TaxID=166423 RepID=A0A0N0U475_9HYME|nr:Mediator of RNA polymerase II transcription subunit 16 [Melipona quadrifasciata]
MDLLYTVNRKVTLKPFLNQESLYEGQSLCSLSSRNIAAFTTTTELDDNSGKTWGSHVYVCDLNMPWHTHKVLSNKNTITALEWDLPGDKLVVCDSVGNVQLWMFKDHVLNDWVPIGSTCFVGEHILGAAWFHNGKKTGLVTEKKDNIHYSEKFNHLPFVPSVRQFGGRAAEGVLVVSTTGMVGAVMITKDLKNPICSSTESLGSTRHRITTVDLCYGKNGHILVAISSGNICLPIRCYRVLVRKNDDKCTITSQALPSFFLQDGAPKDNTYTSVTHLKFVVREDADSLVIAVNSDNGGVVEVWELREKTQPVHKLFQPKTLEPFKTVVVWQHQSQYRCQSPIVALATTKLSIVTTLPPPSYVVVALADSSIHCLSRDCLKEIAFSSLNMAWRPEEPSNKYFKNSVSIASIDLSWLGCVLLTCDTRGNLYLYKLLPDGGPSLTLSYACTLLEYCLVTGLDWLDMLLCLRSSMIEPLCERLDVSFNRQLQPIQQYHYIQFLCIKTSLYRMLVPGQSKAADLSSLLMIHSVATAFKSLLRPSDLISHDKGPAESLATVINDSITDVDKVLLHLDPKEFTVEPSTLQSLQQLIQWVADLALNLLARLPEQRLQIKSGGVSIANKFQAYELLKDHKALNTLRELLVIIRIWGLLRPSCLPVFLRSADNLDVLALLFRLLSKLVQPNGDGQTQQIDDGLIELDHSQVIKLKDTKFSTALNDSISDKDKSSTNSYESQHNKIRKHKDLPPLVIHRRNSGKNVEHVGTVNVEENVDKNDKDEDILKSGNDILKNQRESMTDYLKLVTVTPQDELDVKSPKRPLSPRELFFIDLIKEAEKAERNRERNSPETEENQFFPSNFSQIRKNTKEEQKLSNVLTNKEQEVTYFIADIKNPRKEKNDCCLLPNQIMIPQLHQGNSITAIATPVLFYQSFPLQLEYGIEPEQLLFVPELNPVEGCMYSGQVVDGIRHLYLGKQPLLVKQCTRCVGKAQVQNMTRTAAIRAWDQRWARACRCGGIWRIHKTSS